MINQHIALVGPMGSGKTTIGKQLASSLELAFCDLDAEIESRTGVDIATIFDIEGESGFRNRETALLNEYANQRSPVMVYATGGGVVLREKNRELLQDMIVVYLASTYQQIYQRLRYDKKRPLLAVDDPKAAIKRIIEERQPLYESVADIVVLTNRKSPKKILHEVNEKLASFRQG